jgi:hypothetical protein
LGRRALTRPPAQLPIRPPLTVARDVYSVWLATEQAFHFGEWLATDPFGLSAIDTGWGR